jgi:hypothetical protein
MSYGELSGSSLNLSTARFIRMVEDGGIGVEANLVYVMVATTLKNVTVKTITFE